MEEETAITLEGTTESDESQIAQAERKKFPILFVESEKSKSNPLEEVTDSIVDNSTLGKLNATPSEY